MKMVKNGDHDRRSLWVLFLYSKDTRTDIERYGHVYDAITMQR